MTRWNSRIPTTLNNMRAMRGWGLKELDNLARFIGLGRNAGFGVAKPAFLRSLMDTLTRLPFEYMPLPDNHAGLSPESLYQRPARDPYHEDEPAVALFVDSPEHTSGVSTTIGQWVAESRRQGLELTVLSSGSAAPPAGFLHFPACGLLRLPCYAGLELPVPRVRKVLDFLDAHPFDAYHISTPGPMGLIGLLHARCNGIPVCGTYHTDFPGYAAQLTHDPALRDTAWGLMKAFYGAMDAVTTPSEATRAELIENGFAGKDLVVVGRGVSCHAFAPERRDTRWHSQWRSTGKHHLLYVGRISREKNLHVLVDAFRKLCARRDDAVLVVVGEGPYRVEMEEALNGCPVVFTGIQKGEHLASLYASCDLFVFPSETDTFGIVLIEAQASGLPVLVAPKGGPRYTMLDNHTGLVVEPMSGPTLSTAIDDLLGNPQRRAGFSKQARAHALTLTPEASFNAFWAAHKRPLEGRLRARRPPTASAVSA